MKRMISILLLPVMMVGCYSSDVEPRTEVKAPVFKLCYSEYPSWSIFAVAGEQGLLNPEEGQSELEKKYGVDIVLVELDYDRCMQYYAANSVDMACLTNTDVLSKSMGRPATAILPTSTSDGADAVIVGPGIDKVQDLKGVEVYGLEESVSDYVFYRGLEELGQDIADYKFVMQDPAAAANTMAGGSDNVKAICVWNPFKMTVLETRSDTKVLFDSTLIPDEVVDMVIMGNDSLKREGGEAAARCVAEAFYQMCDKMNGPERSETLVALGANFSNLNADQMAKVCTETKFYDTPEKARELLSSRIQDTMPIVLKSYIGRDIVPAEIEVSYTYDPNGRANLTFTDAFLK